MAESYGILYTATGKMDYVREAERSLRSLRRHDPGLPAALATDLDIPEHNELWQHIIRVDDLPEADRRGMASKFAAWDRTPFERNIYVDSDTYFFAGISEVYRLFDRFDMIVSHGHERELQLQIEDGTLRHPMHDKAMRTSDPDVPRCFTIVQGGFIGFRQSSEWEAIKTSIKEEFAQQEFWGDQPLIRKALWRSSIRFYVLPPEYNFCHLAQLRWWKRGLYRVAKPVMWHHAANKRDNIVRRARPFEKPLSPLDFRWAKAKSLAYRAFTKVTRKLIHWP